MSLSLLITSFLLANPLVLLSSYVSMGNSFPKPLSEEEEEHYLILYEQGDEDAKNKLIEHNLRLVAHIVKKYSNTGKDPDDLISIGTIGLIKSVNTYNRNKGVRLATYSARCIENAILSQRCAILYSYVPADCSTKAVGSITVQSTKSWEKYFKRIIKA